LTSTTVSTSGVATTSAGVAGEVVVFAGFWHEVTAKTAAMGNAWKRDFFFMVMRFGGGNAAHLKQL
jgi:hypothetical protein